MYFSCWVYSITHRNVDQGTSDHFFFENDVLCYQWTDAIFTRKLLVVLKGFKNWHFGIFYDHNYTGDMGHGNTRQNIKTCFYWHHLYADVSNHVKSAAARSMNETTNKKRKAEIVHYHTGFPMKRVHIDMFGPFNVSFKGNKYILWKVDQFAKWLESVLTPNQAA